MELTRKIGIAIVMMIPAFVTGGLIYDLFGWSAVLGIEVAIAIIYCFIILKNSQVTP